MGNLYSRKDYVAAAGIIKEWKTAHHLTGIVVQEAFIKFFQIDNERFDVDKFRDSCMHPADEALMKRHGLVNRLNIGQAEDVSHGE